MAMAALPVLRDSLLLVEQVHDERTAVGLLNLKNTMSQSPSKRTREIRGDLDAPTPCPKKIKLEQQLLQLQRLQDQFQLQGVARQALQIPATDKVQAQPLPTPKRGRGGRSSSKFRGVCWLKDRKAWRARIEVGGKREHLGYFDSEERAARAYDARARELNGPTARVNFSDENPPVVPITKSNSNPARPLTPKPRRHSSSSSSSSNNNSSSSHTSITADAVENAPMRLGASRPLPILIPPVGVPHGPPAMGSERSLATTPMMASSAGSPMPRSSASVTSLLDINQLYTQALRLDHTRSSVTYVPSLERWVVHYRLGDGPEHMLGTLFEDEQSALGASLAMRQITPLSQLASPTPSPSAAGAMSSADLDALLLLPKAAKR